MSKELNDKLATVDLYASHMEVQFKDKSRKAISVSDFIDRVGKAKPLSYGILPTRLRFLEVQDKQHIFAIEWEPRPRQVGYMGKQLEFFCPATLFVGVAEFQAGNPAWFNLRRSWMFLLKENLLAPNANLYVFPFGNVWKDKVNDPNGNICWGGALSPLIENRQIQKVAHFGAFENRFWTGDFNHDLYVQYTLAEWARMLKKPQSFPDSGWMKATEASSFFKRIGSKAYG